MTGSRTLADLLPRAVSAFGDSPAIKLKNEAGDWVTRSYAEVGGSVRELALGLIELGIEPGDRISILAHTRPEWTYADFAALTIGAVVVPLYQTSSPEECRYVIGHSDARALIVEDAEQLGKLREIRETLPELEHVILIEGSADDALSLAELAERGRRRDLSEWVARYEAVAPDDVATIIYTSGTTGPPKGCVISHGNYRAMLDMAERAAVIAPGETAYLFLPLAHSFALLIQLYSFDIGGVLAYWERNPLQIIPNLSEVRPEHFPSVPRVFEKIYATATGAAEKEGRLKRRIFWWAVGVGRRVRELERAGGRPGFLLRRKHGFADRRVLSRIRNLFGGRIKQCVTGAAPINPEILRFFDAAGVLILEGYGMTETSTAVTISTPEAFRFGTVGRPLDGNEVRIATDGEVLVRGPNVFQGYYKDDDATREAIVDGWLHTGDLGELDEDGFLRITGRKKDIIITAGGKNISPANLEAEIKQHPLVSQCVVIGDRRPYLVALITLDPEDAAKHGSEDGGPDEPAALADDERVRASISEHVDRVNQRVARVEQVKRFAVLPADLSQEAGELTPTLKVKRDVVAERYADRIEALYAS